ncbi:hypothetical protein AgCh_040105 [Apium graveolens]
MAPFHKRVVAFRSFSSNCQPHQHTLCWTALLKYGNELLSVPRESLLFVIPAFGGVLSWEGEGAPFKKTDQGITYQVSLELHFENGFTGLCILHFESGFTGLCIYRIMLRHDDIAFQNYAGLFSPRLAYLYKDIEPKVVHWDIKSSNIMIDHEFNSKVSYFGLAKLLESASEVSLKTKETIGLHDITESVKIVDVPQPPVQNLDIVGTARILDISEATNESRSVNEAVN